MIRFSFTERLCISSVIRQKGESQNGFYKKTKYAKYTYVCVSGGRAFGVLCFLVTPVFRFAFLPYYLRYHGLCCLSKHNFSDLEFFLLFFNNCFTFLAFPCLMSQNGQTQFKNLVAFAEKFLNWIWPFRDIMH